MFCFNTRQRAGWGFINADKLPGLKKSIIDKGSPVIRPEHKKEVQQRISDTMCELEGSIQDQFISLGLNDDEATDFAGDMLNATDKELTNLVALRNDKADIMWQDGDICYLYRQTKSGDCWIIVVESSNITYCRVFGEDNWPGAGWLESTVKFDNDKGGYVITDDAMPTLAIPQRVWEAYDLQMPYHVRDINKDGIVTDNAWHGGVIKN